jgi:hypothetical protein
MKASVMGRREDLTRAKGECRNSDALAFRAGKTKPPPRTAGA